MAEPRALSGFQRYLAAKRSVDDRALNRVVWAQLQQELATRPLPRTLRILELGCGIGTMVERLLEWGLIDQAHYLGIDAEPENIAVAGPRLEGWAGLHGFRTLIQPDSLRLQRGQQDWQVRFVCADLVDDWLPKAPAGGYDLLIAQAFLDLVDIPAILPQLTRLLAPH